jgi:FtsH-binding integral membrane protein
VSNVFADFGAGLTAFSAPLDARLAFIRRTYLHLAAAMGLLVAVSAALYSADVGIRMVQWMSGAGAMGMILFFVGLMGATWLASSLAWSNRGSAVQYAGLIGYTLIQAVFISPLIAIAARAFPGSHILETAAGLTLLVFGGLSGYVLITRKDLSFLGPILFVSFLVLMGVAVASMIFSFNLGLLYSGAMILFAAGVILYQTSEILHRLRTDQHVGAALALLSAVVLLFIRILVLLMQLQGGGRRSD